MSFADYLFLYENRAKKILIENNFYDKKIHVVYNSINLITQTKVFNKLIDKIQSKKSSNLYNLIFFGRLTKIKKLIY